MMNLFICLLSFLFFSFLIPYSKAMAQENAKTSFVIWLEEFRKEAKTRGIAEKTLITALQGLEPIPRIIELDRRQPEVRLTFEEYLQRVVPESRVITARQKLRENHELIARIASRFSVQPRFIVALWGIESDFGRFTGGFPVIAALATLAYDGRRGSYFRNELLEALRIIDAGYASAHEMTGSWAGAMGHLQFMPSTIRRHWIDYNGNGLLDIWQSSEEAMASAANYLSKLGWRKDQTWGRRVKLPNGFDTGFAGLGIQKPLSEWQRLGVRSADGSNLPKPDFLASLVTVEDGGPAFLVYDNYRLILNWNRSTFFAVSVGYLSDQLREP